MSIAGRIGDAALDVVLRIPGSRNRRSPHPSVAARGIARQAATKAALAAGSLSLPVGPLGWLTILPELAAIWRVQSQLVADIAATYGRHEQLGREQMMYCLFRHMASQAVRELVIVSGQKLVVMPASVQVLQSIARKIGVKLSQQVIGKAAARWIPLIGAAGIGAWAYRDTMRVAKTAIEMFEADARRELEASQPRGITHDPLTIDV